MCLDLSSNYHNWHLSASQAITGLLCLHPRQLSHSGSHCGGFYCQAITSNKLIAFLWSVLPIFIQLVPIGLSVSFSGLKTNFSHAIWVSSGNFLLSSHLTEQIKLLFLLRCLGPHARQPCLDMGSNYHPLIQIISHLLSQSCLADRLSCGTEAAWTHGGTQVNITSARNQSGRRKIWELGLASLGRRARVDLYTHFWCAGFGARERSSVNQQVLQRTDIHRK